MDRRNSPRISPRSHREERRRPTDPPIAAAAAPPQYNAGACHDFAAAAPDRSPDRVHARFNRDSPSSRRIDPTARRKLGRSRSMRSRSKAITRNSSHLQTQQSQTELAAERARPKDLEERSKRYALDRELALALASKPLVAGGAEHLTRLLRDDFQVAPAGDSFVVQSKDFRSVGDYLGAMLGRPEYQCFVRSNNPTGGSGAQGGGLGRPDSPANPAVDATPQTFSDAVIALSAAQKATGKRTPNSIDRSRSVFEDSGRRRRPVNHHGISSRIRHLAFDVAGFRRREFRDRDRASRALHENHIVRQPSPENVADESAAAAGR